MWGATAFADISAKIQGFQSTLPVWGATKLDIDTVDALIISIHAPRVGSDKLDNMINQFPKHFNPRSPCGERRGCIYFALHGWLYFNPRSPCGERPEDAVYDTLEMIISIHAPRVGSDNGFRDNL